MDLGVGLLRILGVGVRIFDPTLTPKVLRKGFLTMKLWEDVANALRLFFSEFSLFCQKVHFFTL